MFEDWSSQTLSQCLLTSSGEVVIMSEQLIRVAGESDLFTNIKSPLMEFNQCSCKCSSKEIIFNSLEWLSCEGRSSK